MSQESISIPEQESISVTIKIKKTFRLKLNKRKKRYDEVFFIIYKTTNLLKSENEPHRIYVGQHIQYNKNPYEFDGYLGSGTVIENAVKKYGKKNFKRETLEVCNSLQELNERELFWIEELKANFKKYPDCGGMNIITHNHFNGRFVKDEQKEKLSKTNDNRQRGEGHYLFGKHRSDDVKKKISENQPDSSGENNSFYGRHHTEESIKKMIENRPDQSGENNPMYGQHHTEESKRLMSEKKKGRYKHDNHPRCAYNYELSNGEDYWEFFNERERKNITQNFNRLKTNTITYKGITITRVLKNPI